MKPRNLPGLDKTYLVRANPHWGRDRDLKVALYKRISSAIALLVMGAIGSVLLLQPYHDTINAEAFSKARSSALIEFQSEFKTLLVAGKDRDLINKVCNSWWFELDATKRKVSK